MSTGSSIERSPVWGTCIALCCACYFFVHPFFPQHTLYAWFISFFPDEKSCYIWGTAIIHFVVWIVGNAIIQLCYSMKHPMLEQYKIQQTKVWPWERGDEEAAEYRTLIKKSIAILLFNHLIIGPLVMSHNYEIAKSRHIQFSVETIPPWYVAMIQIICFMMIEDTLFYWAHRLLHHRWIYGYVHKYHHQYKTTIGVASEHAHPVEFLLSNGLPFMVGPLLFGCHMAVFWQWELLRVAEAIEGHSGYEFPWSPFRLLPFSGSATQHDFHHSHNIGNFSSFFTWWDHMMGTDVAWLKYHAKLQDQARVVTAPMMNHTYPLSRHDHVKSQ